MLTLKFLTAIMSRLKYAQKFLLLSVLFLIPLVTLLNIWLGQLQDNIEEAQDERVGVDYIQNLMPFMIHVQQHRGHANGYLNGNYDSQKNMAEAAQLVDEDIQRIEAANLEASGVINVSEAWSDIQREWTELQASTTSLTAPESFARHSELVQNVQELIISASDQSGLSLDSAVESFYLMDVVVNRAPALIELTAKARGQGNGILSKKSMTVNENITLAVERQQMEETLAGLTKALDRAADADPELAESITEIGQHAIDSISEYMKTIDGIIQNAANTTSDPAQFFAAGTSTIDNLMTVFNSASNELSNLLDDRVDSIQSERNLMLILIGIAVLLVIGFYLAFYRNVQSTIRSLQHGANRFASGDLSERIALNTRDELRHVGEAFNEMASSLTALLRRNQEISEQVAASSQQLSAVSTESSKVMEQIASSVGNIAEGADAQLKAFEENSITMNEMATVIAKIADAASEVSEAASDASQGAQAGEEKLHLSNGQMAQIQEAVLQTNERVMMLNEHSNNIQSILQTIMEISSQTHLLSLNANIEAARAGEQGRGFMVVAKEVGKLAAQTTESAKSISTLLEDVRQVVDQVVESMQETSRVTEIGIHNNREVVDTMGTILGSIRQVADQIQEVSAAAEQASASTDEVLSAYADMVQISKRTADETREMAAATEEQLSSMEEVNSSSDMLSASATQLQDELGRFILKR